MILLLVIALALFALFLYYAVITIDVMRRLPPEGRKAVDGVTTIDDALRACRASGLQGWALVEYAQSLAARKFSYSRRNPWDTPARAFERGMGYCMQQAYALKLIYDRLGIQAWPVQGMFCYFPPETIHDISEEGGVSGHAWLRVRLGDEVKDVCPGNLANRPGVVHFEILSPVTRLTFPGSLLAHLGSVAVNAARDRAALRRAAAGDQAKEPPAGLIERGEPLRLDAAARADLSGQFVELPDGFVHYEAGGPESGPAVLLVHGFSVPYYTWDSAFIALVQAGFRTVRFDLYGRGYSDRPDLPYTLALFVRQIAGLLSALHINRPVDLVGLSLGGPIVAAFASQYPGMARRLCLVDPSGFAPGRPASARLTGTPVMGEVLFGLLGARLLTSRVLDDFVQPLKFPEYKTQYFPPMQYRGFKRALLSTLRFGPLGDQIALYRQVAASGRHVLLVWGRQDKTFPFDLHEKALQVFPQARFLAVDQAGHAAHYERPDVVNPALVEFLSHPE